MMNERSGDWARADSRTSRPFAVTIAAVTFVVTYVRHDGRLRIRWLPTILALHVVVGVHVRRTSRLRTSRLALASLADLGRQMIVVAVTSPYRRLPLRSPLPDFSLMIEIGVGSYLGDWLRRSHAIPFQV